MKPKTGDLYKSYEEYRLVKAVSVTSVYYLTFEDFNGLIQFPIEKWDGWVKDAELIVSGDDDKPLDIDFANSLAVQNKIGDHLHWLLGTSPLQDIIVLKFDTKKANWHLNVDKNTIAQLFTRGDLRKLLNGLFTRE